MALQSSDTLLPTSNMDNRNRVYVSNKLDITTDYFHELNLMAGVEGSITGIDTKSPDQLEKQISVDPISLRESSYRGEVSFDFMLSPIAPAPNQPPHLPPIKPRLISYSLPNSACSSPRYSLSLSKKKWKNDSQASPQQINNMARKYSKLLLPHCSMRVQKEIHLGRSKSCGEGRSCVPADELDFLFNTDSIIYDKNVSRIETQKDDCANNNSNDKKTIVDTNDEEFKCGALCLYLPGFGKAKPAKPRKQIIEIDAGIGSVISRTVSLEKFECGSWASSAIIAEQEDDKDHNINLFFDLPLELIQTSVNDATSPVAAAFVFDKDQRAGVLKNSNTRKSHESSSRHVRFSISSPTFHSASPASSSSADVTPRLRKAREDFNAFLEAQNV